MSDTPTTAPTPTQPPLISSSPATQATAAGSGGAAAAVVSILCWQLGVHNIPVPPEVAASFSFIVGMGVHWAALKYGMPTS